MIHDTMLTSRMHLGTSTGPDPEWSMVEAGSTIPPSAPRISEPAISAE